MTRREARQVLRQALTTTAPHVKKDLNQQLHKLVALDAKMRRK
jgi:hypothetical protein